VRGASAMGGGAPQEQELMLAAAWIYPFLEKMRACEDSSGDCAPERTNSQVTPSCVLPVQFRPASFNLRDKQVIRAHPTGEWGAA
jgi:hypothetical protein